MAPNQFETILEVRKTFSMPPHLVIIIIAAVVVICWKLIRIETDPREPPVATSNVPFIGHIIGLMRHQGDYFKSLSAKYLSWPIFTLEILSAKIYVVSSPELAQSLLCNTKSVSFYPFHIAFTNRALGARQEIKDIVAYNGADNRYMQAIHQEMYSALAMGPSLLETNRRLINSLARYLNAIGTSDESRELFDWMKIAYTLSLAESFYGPQNPIVENPTFVKNIWDFEEGLPTLFLNLFPSVTARKAYEARKVMAPAFQEYYDKGLDKNANSFIKGRAKAARVENFTNKDLAGFEITICFASLTNTVPNAFSMLCNILSDPVLTADICEEVAGVATRTMINGITQVAIDITLFNTKCPLLVSAFQETIRVCVNATPVRVVMEDMLLKDTYLLKKGGIVQVAGGAIHESRKIWGDDADTFNGRRFMNKEGLTREQKKAQAHGLLPFGGGKHLCPGRHLAFTEIVSFVAMMVYGFEVQMKDGSGLVVPPPFKTQQVGENSKKPAHDIEVLIRRKQEFEGVTWIFHVDPSANMGKVSVF